MELSTKARTLRNESAKTWRKNNPENVQAIRRRYWEKKAREHYGKDYEPPKDDTTLSPQAVKIRRDYYASYRKNNPDIIAKSISNYWERKTKEL